MISVSLPDIGAFATAALACIGVGQAFAGWLCVERFAARARLAPANNPLPPITVLKPLYGDEPLLEEGLTTFCQQDYPDWQIVFGVQSPSDPAIQVVERLKARFPQLDIDLVIDSRDHGPNRKVGNLINMFPAARHDILVIADSDLLVRPDYLRHLVDALEKPTVGLVTTLYAGLPAEPSLASSLGATQITHCFLPGALLARSMGRSDCLGATMCLRRETLAAIGGLHALVPHLADDNVLGLRVSALGLKVTLATTIPLTVVPETTLGPLYSHELRWSRTIRALVPAAHAASALQYPLFWAAMAMCLSGFAVWSVGLFGLVWVGRALAGAGIDRALGGFLPGLEFSCPVWLLPLRDALSIVVLLAGHAGSKVEWRGHGLYADTPPPPDTQISEFRPAEGLRPR